MQEVWEKKRKKGKVAEGQSRGDKSPGLVPLYRVEDGRDGGGRATDEGKHRQYVNVLVCGS